MTMICLTMNKLTSGLTRDQAEEIYGELDSSPEEPLGDPDGSSSNPYRDRLLEKSYTKET